MKKLLKYFRSVRWINFILRKSIKGTWSLMNKIYTFSSDHLILSGVEKIYLPNNQYFKIFSEGDDFIPNQVYWKGYKGYEESVNIFYNLSLYSKTIIDIGANIGYYSLVAAAANPQTQIYAFEPVERVFRRFEKQIKINNFTNIQSEKTVISNYNGEITFYVPTGNEMSLASSVKKGWVTNVSEELVNCVSLDSYSNSKKTGKIDLIKIDCELHEYEILQGMSEIMKNDSPAILMEVMMPDKMELSNPISDYDYLNIQTLMKMHGYIIYFINNEVLVKVDKFEYNPFERNYLFVKFNSENTVIQISEFIKEYFKQS